MSGAGAVKTNQPEYMMLGLRMRMKQLRRTSVKGKSHLLFSISSCSFLPPLKLYLQGNIVGAMLMNNKCFKKFNTGCLEHGIILMREWLGSGLGDGSNGLRINKIHNLPCSNTLTPTIWLRNPYLGKETTHQTCKMFPGKYEMLPWSTKSQ
ncbi:hypothetical protein YC2023_027221 [Brassica napus]